MVLNAASECDVRIRHAISRDVLKCTSYKEVHG